MISEVKVERGGTTVWVKPSARVSRAFIRSHFTGTAQTLEGQALVADMQQRVKEFGQLVKENYRHKMIVVPGRPVVSTTYLLMGIKLTLLEGLCFYKIDSYIGTRKKIVLVFNFISQRNESRTI